MTSLGRKRVTCHLRWVRVVWLAMAVASVSVFGCGESEDVGDAKDGIYSTADEVADEDCLTRSPPRTVEVRVVTRGLTLAADSEPTLTLTWTGEGYFLAQEENVDGAPFDCQAVIRKQFDAVWDEEAFELGISARIEVIDGGECSEAFTTDVPCESLNTYRYEPVDSLRNSLPGASHHTEGLVVGSWGLLGR